MIAYFIFKLYNLAAYQLKAYVGQPAIDTPHKKTRSRGITEQQKQENQKKARKRVVVEHLIRLVKTFLVAAERFR
jgi:hypothetical protein